MRNKYIDQLRGLSIIAVIFIHCTVLYWNNKIAHTLWDYSQFAVPVIMFCAGYVFMLKPPSLTFKSLFSYMFKRIKRLITPYYFFLIIFTLILSLKKIATLDYFIKSIFLIGGWDINWLVGLFVIYVIVAPLLWYIFSKHNNFFKILITALILISIYFFNFRFPYNHMYITWLMWAPLYTFPWFLKEDKKLNKKLSIITILGFIVYIFLRFYEAKTNKPSSMFSHKYPPDIHMLSYGFFSTSLLYLVSLKNIFSNDLINKTLYFFSSHSYPLFFIHYILIYLSNTYLKLSSNIHWIPYFLIIITVSTLTQIGYIKIEEKVKKYLLKNSK